MENRRDTSDFDLTTPISYGSMTIRTYELSPRRFRPILPLRCQRVSVRLTFIMGIILSKFQ